MPGPTQGDRLLKLEELVFSLNERTDALRHGVHRLEEARPPADRSLAEVDRRLALVEQRVSDMKASLDASVARRWELSKLVIVAFVSSILTFALSLASNYISRLTDSNINAAMPQDSTTDE